MLGGNSLGDGRGIGGVTKLGFRTRETTFNLTTSGMLGCVGGASSEAGTLLGLMSLARGFTGSHFRPKSCRTTEGVVRSPSGG